MIRMRQSETDATSFLEEHSPKAPPRGNDLRSILSQALGLFTYPPWFMWQGKTQETICSKRLSSQEA